MTTEISKELILKHIVRGNMTLKNFAKRFGVSVSTVSNAIKKHNIDVMKEREKYLEEMRNKKIKYVNSLNEFGISGYYTTKRYYD